MNAPWSRQDRRAAEVRSAPKVAVFGNWNFCIPESITLDTGKAKWISKILFSQRWIEFRRAWGRGIYNHLLIAVARIAAIRPISLHFPKPLISVSFMGFPSGCTSVCLSLSLFQCFSVCSCVFLVCVQSPGKNSGELRAYEAEGKLSFVGNQDTYTCGYNMS